MLTQLNPREEPVAERQTRSKTKKGEEKPVKFEYRAKKGEGLEPVRSKLVEMADANYKSSGSGVDGFQIVADSPTLKAFKDLTDNTIVLAIRGTKLNDWNDIKADMSLLVNNLTNTKRYKADKALVESVLMQYPADQFDYYLTGHSLGGAIALQLRRDFPMLKSGATFNAAFQPVDLVKPDEAIKPVYTEKDPLGIIGRVQAGSEVIPDKGVLPIPYVENVVSHGLDNFKGRGMKKRR